MTFRKHISTAKAAASVHGVSAIENTLSASFATNTAARLEYLRDARADAEEILKDVNAAIAIEEAVEQAERQKVPA
jgi:hypothetical protein